MASPARLILWPTVITAAVSGLRLVGQLQGWFPTASGGRLWPLGITWLVFVFGAWFALRLRRAGSRPSVSSAWMIAGGLLIGLIVTVMSQFGGLDRDDTTEAADRSLRDGVLVIVCVAWPLALAGLWLWPKLAWTLLLYAIPARATVVAITWFAKASDWDTHYTKFGPAGIERGEGETLFAASLAQFGFWVPFTVVGGLVAGCLVAGRRPRTSS